MMFLILGDNASHVFFNIWGLPRPLRLYNTKVKPIISMTITKCPKNISHDQNYMSNKNFPQQKITCPKDFPMTKITCQKKFPQPKPICPKIVHNQKSCTQKGQCSTTTKNQCPTQNFSTIKIFHMSIHNYQIIFFFP